MKVVGEWVYNYAVAFGPPMEHKFQSWVIEKCNQKQSRMSELVLLEHIIIP